MVVAIVEVQIGVDDHTVPIGSVWLRGGWMGGWMDCLISIGSGWLGKGWLMHQFSRYIPCQVADFIFSHDAVALQLVLAKNIVIRESKKTLESLYWSRCLHRVMFQ